MRLLMGSERRVYFDEVFVPDDCRVGPAYQGWEIAMSVIEAERGGAGFRVTDDGTIESVYQYLQRPSETTSRERQIPSPLMGEG